MTRGIHLQVLITLTASLWKTRSHQGWRLDSHQRHRVCQDKDSILEATSNQTDKDLWKLHIIVEQEWLDHLATVAPSAATPKPTTSAPTQTAPSMLRVPVFSPITKAVMVMSIFPFKEVQIERQASFKIERISLIRVVQLLIICCIRLNSRHLRIIQIVLVLMAKDLKKQADQELAC